MQILRLTTVHPMLVHFTIGALPLIVLAYIMAAARKSPRWTFAADAALVVTAVITLATATFGLVSNFALEWPGGIGTWRWLHLGFGAASAALLVAFAAWRLRLRGREVHSGGGAALGALAISAVIGWTGWIGGEVLVFRSGMAVEAAANGALAPMATRTGQPPSSVEDAMHQLRAHWAATTTSVASMVVEEPRPDELADVARHADRMHVVATWLSNLDGHGPHLPKMGAELASATEAMSDHARADDLHAVAASLGEVTAVCAGCHQELRWREHAHP